MKTLYAANSDGVLEDMSLWQAFNVLGLSLGLALNRQVLGFGFGLGSRHPCLGLLGISNGAPIL